MARTQRIRRAGSRGTVAVAVLVAVLALAPSRASAEPAIDQSQTQTTGYNSTLAGGRLGQTFTAGLSGDLTTVEVYVHSSGDPTIQATAEIRAGGTTGTLLASQVVAVSTTPGWVTIEFASPADVVEDDVYAIVLTHGSPGDALWWWLTSSTADPYAGGSPDPNPFPTFPFPSDYAFRTYVDDAPDADIDFDWSVPERFGRDDNGDGMVDYTQPDGPVPVEPSAGWPVDFVASDSDPCDAGRSRTWRVDGVEITTTDPRATVLSEHGCDFSYRFEEEGVFTVQLEVSDAEGVVIGTKEREVVVQDWLIVSLGDSVASGEGTPDVPAGLATRWEDDQCHRSASSGPARAASLLERADEKTSVTFVHLACSGATVAEGLIGRYAGIEPGYPKARPQIDTMSSLAGDRELDAVVVSIGANDVQFAHIVERCFRRSGCDRDEPGSMYRFFNGRVALLRGWYDLVDAEFELQPDPVPPDRVYLTEYFDPTRDESEAYCDDEILEEAVDIPQFGIDATEAEWASTDMLRRLNATGSGAVNEHGWTRVGGIFSAFGPHGYCSTDRWVVQLTESFAQQGDKNGTLHPNEAGHAHYGQRIAGSLTADLYIGGDLDTPRAPE